MITISSFLPMSTHAQDCLNYETYLRWVAAIDLETASNAVTIAGDHAYVAKGNVSVGGLEIIDISVPNTPLLVGVVDLPGYGKDVVVSGNYAYVADGWAGLQIIDVSDPSTPLIVGTMETPDSASDVALFDHYAYVAEWNTGRLHVVDVSDPSSPVMVGGVDAQDDIKDLVIADGFAYVLYRFIHPGTAGLQIFDLADPQQPSLVTDFSVQDWGSGLAVVDTRAYVVSSLLQVLDVTDPTSPTILGSVEVPHGGREVAVSGDRAYVGLGLGQPGLATFDISQPSSPTVMGVIYTIDEPRGLAISGAHAYMANTYSGLNVIDITVPDAPPTGVLMDSTVWPVTLTGNGQYVYVAGYGAENLQVVDASNPLTPVPLGTVGTPGVIGDMVVVGQHVYAADDSTGLHVVDVSDPEAPQIVEVVDASGEVRGVAANGGYLFASYAESESSLLRVMDISLPSAPIIVGSVEVPRGVGKIASANNLVYAINNNNAEFSGLTIVDVTDPSAPFVMGMIDTPGLLYDVAIDGTVAYLGSGTFGTTSLQMVDVSDPAMPTLMGGVMLPGGGRAVTVHHNHAYIAVPKIGLVIVDITDPYAGFLVGAAAAGASPGSPRDVAFLNGQVFLASMGGLGICLPQCSDVVPVYFSDFTVTSLLDAVHLQWTISNVGDDDEFRIEGRQAGRQWSVPAFSNGDGNFLATDDVAGWIHGDPRTYSLYRRSSGSAWMLLATQSVERVVSARRAGLGPIQPNPFNPKTSVSFRVDHAQQVEIAVYDLSGRRVAVLADQVYGVGEYTTYWDGRDTAGRAVSSGTYMVRFLSDQQMESRKIMLVR